MNWILSFVVQNYSTNPFLIKTQRYHYTILSNNTYIFSLFIKNITCLNYLTWSNLLHTPLIRQLWYVLVSSFTFKFLKKIKAKRFGILTNNLTKTSMFLTFQRLNTLMLNKPIKVLSFKHTLSWSTVKYLQPISIFAFAFQKSTYNTLMFYIFFHLINNYTSTKNFFKLYYSFVLNQSVFKAYPFVGLFYFRVRHY